MLYDRDFLIILSWNDVSGPTDIGMSRLTLGDADKQARDWFVETTKSLGCKVQVDAMGEFSCSKKFESKGWD